VVWHEKAVSAHEDGSVPVDGRIPVKHPETVQKRFTEFPEVFGVEEEFSIIIAPFDTLAEEWNHGPQW
jgi:hypothetical protein